MNRLKDKYPFSFEKELEWTRLISKGEGNEAVRFLRHILDEKPVIVEDSNNIQECLVWNFATCVLRIENNVINMDTPGEEANWLEKFCCNISIDNKVMLLERRILQVCEAVGNQKMNCTPLDVWDIQQYILDNYADINLNNCKIAEYFHVNAAYLSTFYKRETGTNLSNYIQCIRLEKAKKLLRNTNLTIEETARAVGCNNSIALIRMFKRLDGTTPTAYREAK